MSKPLELTIYPPLSEEPNPVRDGWDAWHEWDALFTKEIRIRRSKRLAEAELCAEYWRHEGDYRMLSDGYSIESFGTTIPQPPWVTEDLERDRVATLHRFATHPHYFEATEPESDTE